MPVHLTGDAPITATTPDTTAPVAGTFAVASYAFDSTGVDGTGHTITLAAAHGLVIGDTVNLLYTTVTGSAPTGLTTATVYGFKVTSATVLSLDAITDAGAGTYTLTRTEPRAIVVNIGAGTDTSGVGLTRILGVYTDATMLLPVATYPRYVGYPGEEVAGYWADGLTPTTIAGPTAYYLGVTWLDEADNLPATAVRSGTTATVTTTVAHNLSVGDRVRVTDAPTAWKMDPIVTVLTVPSSTTFTYECFNMGALTATAITIGSVDHSLSNTVTASIGPITTAAEVGGPAALITGNPLLVIDDRAEHRGLPLELPATPSAPTVVQSDAGGITAFQRTIYPVGGPMEDGTLNITGSTTTPWTKDPLLGGFEDAEWSNQAGSLCMHIDATGALAEGDKVYYTESTTNVDLSNAATMTLELYSGGRENATGGILNLVMAVDNLTGEPDEWFSFPLTIKESGKWETVEANITNFTERSAVRYWGLEATGPPFVVWWRSIRAGSGVYGERDYKVVNRLEYLKMLTGETTPTVLLQLDSIESESLVTPTGTKGQINTLTFSAFPATPAEKSENAEYANDLTHDHDGVQVKWSRLIYGKDVEAGMVDFHLIALTTNSTGTALRTGTTATMTTDLKHGFLNGQIVQIVGEPAAWGPETVTIAQATHTASITRVAKLATVTTTTPHGLENGMKVSIDGTPAWQPVTAKIVTVTSPTTFTYVCADIWGTSTTGRTVTTLIDDTHFTYAVLDAGATSATGLVIVPQNYADSTLDISQGLKLKQARCQIPHAVNAVGTHHRTLDVQKDGKYWFSSVGDITWWSDTAIHEAADVGLGEFDSFWVNLLEAGPVQAIVPLGVYTGADYQGDTLVLCKRQIIYLKGVGYKNVDFGYRVNIGCVGPQAWCKIAAGEIAALTPEGNVYIFDRQLNPTEIGQPIAPELWEIVAP